MKIVIVTDTYLPDVNGVAMTLGRLVKGSGKRVTKFTSFTLPKEGMMKMRLLSQEWAF